MKRIFARQRGFLTFAQNGSTDFVRLAYGLALSIKASQTSVSHLSIVVTPGTPVPERYRRVFDHVIEVPWDDEAALSRWKLENEWKAYHITPYRETIKLDADMLFPEDITGWWDILSRQDFCAATRAETYRGAVVDNDFYRKTFTSNNLPNVYSALTYFKYSDMAESIFGMMELIFHNWEHFSFNYLDDTRPTEVSTDVVLAMAIKLLGLEDAATPIQRANLPTFVHMKTALQGWPDGIANEDWTKNIDTAVTPDTQIRIGRYRQASPLHYHVKEFLSDRIIATYEKKLGLHD